MYKLQKGLMKACEIQDTNYSRNLYQFRRDNEGKRQDII